MLDIIQKQIEGDSLTEKLKDIMGTREVVSLRNILIEIRANPKQNKSKELLLKALKKF